MPNEQVVKLRSAIEAAPEISDAHRSEMLQIVVDLEAEVAQLPDDHEHRKPIRDALELAGRVTNERSAAAQEERSELMEKLAHSVDQLAISHPSIARFLGLLSRML